MKYSRIFVAALLAMAVNASHAVQNVILSQRVLYVGDRIGKFEPFLQEHFATVKCVPLPKPGPPQVENFDVVLLDWPQGDAAREERATMTSPLGKREEWLKPTVLFGSAGLNLAVAWKLKGGSGCTCLAPVAYGLRDHVIFKSPIPIDIHATTNIPTPRTFKPELEEETVDVLPLVDNIRRFDSVINDYERGWSTHYYEFADMPEVEIFCGGINEQTPRSAAFWRQGNLLHFGFQQSPAEMNEVGRAMLINAITYISHFHEDQPIDITPSVFGPEKIGISRRRARNYLTDEEHPVDWVTNLFSAVTLATFNWRDRSEGKAWFEANAKWIHPGPGNFLEIDTEAKQLGVPFDSPDFLPKTIAALREDKTKAIATTLLVRYAPDGPGTNADADTWEHWWRENSPYLFYSELGCYRWYIDPLAKKRGIPTRDLRGPARADKQS